MSLDRNDIWQPDAGYIENAQITRLMRKLAVADFEEFYDLSINEPERYWREIVDFCGIKFSKPYDRWCDLSRGKPFPSWFVGGELNWVDTILDNEAARDRIAIIGETENGDARQLTYRELGDEVRGFAAGLIALGFRKGDRIGLLMENGIEASITLIAIAYIGAIAVPLFSGFGSDAIVARLAPCGARGLIVTSGFQRRGRFVSTAEILAMARSELPQLDLIILKRTPGDPSEPADGCYDWHATMRPAAEAPLSQRMSPDDPFMVIFTSGTTGKPKGAVHVHGGFPVKIAHDSAIHFDVGPGDVFCWPADMGWVAGALILSAALLRGATLVCYDGAPDYPDWSRMGKLVEKYRATHFGSAPTLIRGMASNEATATAADLSSLRVLITAGESIAPEHFTWFGRKFGASCCPVINFTGGTEVSGGLLSSVVIRPIVPGGFNCCSPGVAADVIDQNGNSISNAVGELAIREPFIGMTASFWEDEARYLESYWQTIPGIWLHGDLAMRTEKGDYFLLGRSDDTLKVAGKRVGPAEVEEILAEISGVVEASVIGAPDPVKGQAIIVFLACMDAPKDIRTIAAARIQERLGRPFAPRNVYVVPQLPKTRSSKVMRRVIRSIYSDIPAGDTSSLVNPEAIDEIKKIVLSEGK